MAVTVVRRLHPMDVCAALCVFLIPFRLLIGPAAYNIEWSDLAGLACIAWWLGSGRWKDVGRTGLVAGICVYLLALTCSLPASAHPGHSALELVKTAYVAALGVALAEWASTPERWQGLLSVWAVALGVTMLLAIGVWIYASVTGHVPPRLAIRLAIPNVGHMIRVKALMQTMAMLANYVTMGAPLLAAWAAVRASAPRAACWGVIALAILTAVLTASHGLVGCVIACSLVAPRATRMDQWARRLLQVAAAGLWVFALLSSTVSIARMDVMRGTTAGSAGLERPLHALPDPGGSGQEVAIRIAYDWVSQTRLKILAWNAWRSHPWTGIGIGEFPTVSAAATARGEMNGAWDPHSEWFGALAETGLIGVAGLIAFWMLVIRQAGRTVAEAGAEGWRIRAALAGLIGLLVNSLYADVMHFRFLWVGVALMAAAGRVWGQGLATKHAR